MIFELKVNGEKSDYKWLRDLAISKFRKNESNLDPFPTPDEFAQYFIWQESLNKTHYLGQTLIKQNSLNLTKNCFDFTIVQIILINRVPLIVNLNIRVLVFRFSNFFLSLNFFIFKTFSVFESFSIFLSFLISKSYIIFNFFLIFKYFSVFKYFYL